jgi:hypothetical protein
VLSLVLIELLEFVLLVSNRLIELRRKDIIEKNLVLLFISSHNDPIIAS